MTQILKYFRKIRCLRNWGEDSYLFSFLLHAEVEVYWKTIFIFKESLTIPEQFQSDVNQCYLPAILKSGTWLDSVKLNQTIFKPTAKSEGKKKIIWLDWQGLLCLALFIIAFPWTTRSSVFPTNMFYLTYFPLLQALKPLAISFISYTLFLKYPVIVAFDLLF